MTSTWIDLAQIMVASAAFSMLFLPPGFLVAFLLDIFGFRRQSRAVQALWSLCLSVPLALLLAEGLGRWLPSAAVLWVFLLLAVGATALFAAGWRTGRPRAPKGTSLLLLAGLAVCLYTPFATLDVDVGSRVFAPSVITDWSVRLPMIAAAERHGVPPLNPLSAVGGSAAPLRYYYFWYVLCAVPARALHLSPLAVLTGSATWAGLALLATALLSLRYLLDIRGYSPRRVGFLLLGLCVIGLDALHALADPFRRTPHPLPDIEWWRPDRSPGFRTSMLNGPHHLAGITCCFVAMLLFVECYGPAPFSSSSRDTEPTKASGWKLGSRAVLAGCAFAACAGTSTFLTFVFAGICALWGLDLLRRRRFRVFAALLGTGGTAWALSHPFLRELRTNTSAAHGFASFTLRSGAGARGFLTAHHLFHTHPEAAMAARGVYIAAYTFLELGFFFFVLLDRFRRELFPALRGVRPLTAGQRLLWLVLAVAGFCAMFLSSAVTQSANDLGIHAALTVRFVLVLWSVPFFERLFPERTTGLSATTVGLGGPLRWAALACLVLGLLGEAENLLMERFYYPLMEAHALRGPIQQLVADRLSYRLADTRAAWGWVAAHTPGTVRTQFNPGSALEPSYAYFSNRQIVAVDLGCGTAFGGDPAVCPPLLRDLRQLYGGFPGEEGAALQANITPPPRPSHVAGASDFARTCTADNLQYVFADSTDPAWAQGASWVWTMQPALATQSVRLFACPTR